MHVYVMFQAFLYKILNIYKLFKTLYFSPQAEAQINNIPSKIYSLVFKPE